MTIPGYVEYQRRAFCKDVSCPVQGVLDKQATGTPEHDEVRRICTGHCIHTTYEFHHWLIEKGYLVVKPE